MRYLRAVSITAPRLNFLRNCSALNSKVPNQVLVCFRSRKSWRRLYQWRLTRRSRAAAKTLFLAVLLKVKGCGQGFITVLR